MAKTDDMLAERRVSRGIEAALFLAVFVVGVDTYIVSAILPLMSDALGRSIAALGLLATAYAVPNAVMAPVFGPFSDRFGRKTALIVGGTVFLAAALFTALAPTYPLLIIGRLVNGLGAAIITPAALAYTADRSTLAERGHAMGRLMSAMPFSTILGLPLGAAAAAVLGWRAAFGVIVVIALGALVLLLRIPADRPSAGSALGWIDGYRKVARDRAALGALLVTLVWITGAGGMLVYMGEFFHRAFGIPADRAGLIYITIGVVGVIGTRIGSRYINALGAKRVVLGAIGAFGVASLLIPLTEVSMIWAILNFAMWAFGSWSGIPAQQAIVSNMAEGARGTVLAFNTSALYLGLAVGPVVVGGALDRGGFELAGPFAAGIAALAFVLAVVLLRAPEPATG